MILYFHGGVYVIGSAEASVPLVADLARRTATKVITVDYKRDSGLSARKGEILRALAGRFVDGPSARQASGRTTRLHLESHQ